MRIEQLRRMAGQEEIDYQFLISVLKEYSRPRDKIHAWLKSGDLIRVKKGLYVFGNHVAQQPYSLKILANLIYGPSAISLSYALAYYGMIPERVSLVTSITPKRKKNFTTPVGDFTYFYLSPQLYSVGIQIMKTSSNNQFMIATPEKALCDQIYLIDKRIELRSEADVESYLLHDLRIEEEALDNFKIDTFVELSETYKNKKIDTLTKYIMQRNQ